MIRAASPKLKTYVALAAWSLFLGIALARMELVVIAAPFLTAVLGAALASAPPSVAIDVEVGPLRLIEGDEIRVSVDLSAQQQWNEIELALAVPDGFELVGGERAPTLSLVATRNYTWTLRATRWGARRLGVVGLRLYGPGRLTIFEEVVDRSQAVRVYPSHSRIHKSIPPLDTQIYSGDYVARAAGDGIEFATVRPFVPGDNVRRVNWRVTSRRGTLHVNLAQPERDADLVLFLDTFSQADLQGGTTTATTLDLTVRGAAALAHHHLSNNDRIGLVSFGGMLRWLTASMGRTHTYRIADFLIDVNTVFSFVWKDIELLPRGTLPPKAMVVAFSPLVDDRTYNALADINARGFPVVVINTLVEDAIKPTPGPEGDIAYRAWVLDRARRKEGLKAAGIPVAEWPGDDPIQAVLARLPRRGRRIASRL